MDLGQEFKDKYIKYKKKYINLKHSQTGGYNIQNNFIDIEKKLENKLMTASIRCDNNFKELFNQTDTTSNLIPKMVILYGPPGSGKSSILKYLKENLKIDLPVKILIDDIVIKTSGYEEITDDIINKHAELSAKITSSTDKEELDKILNRLLTDVYNKFRRLKGCGDDISNKLLEESLKARKNIIYEGTGRNSSIDWLLNVCDRAKKEKYDVIIIFPFVKLDILKERVKKRYGKISSSKEPRLIDDNLLTSTFQESHNNFEKIANYYNTDRVFVIDNNATITDPNKSDLYTTLFEINKTKTCNTKITDYTDHYYGQLKDFLMKNCK